MNHLTPDQRKRLLPLIEMAVAKFNAGDWLALGTHTGSSDIVDGHGRLLRSLSFSDPDYSGNAHEVMRNIAQRDPANIDIIDEFVSTRFGGLGVSVSTALSKSRPITFTPSVFETPEGDVENDLVAVMMPFTVDLEPVFTTISNAANSVGLRCLRAKDIWIHETVIQDIFSLIYRSQIVVCDFTGRNANVFYEAGIAHTLGKTVIPITQSEQDVPFDVRHHRFVRYLNNGEGRGHLHDILANRFFTLIPR